MTENFSHQDALDALNAFGADFNRWPDQELAAFVAANPGFSDALKQAAALDAALDTALGTALPHAKASPPDHRLTSRILSLAEQTPQNKTAGSMTNRAEHLPLAPSYHAARAISRFLAARPRFTRIAASLIACLAVGMTAIVYQQNNVDEAILTAEYEAEAARQIANELGLADVFLWAEIDDSAGS